MKRTNKSLLKKTTFYSGQSLKKPLTKASIKKHINLLMEMAKTDEISSVLVIKLTAPKKGKNQIEYKAFVEEIHMGNLLKNQNKYQKIEFELNIWGMEEI